MQITEIDKKEIVNAFYTLENIIKKYNLKEEKNNVRQDWAKEFQKMNKNGDNELLIPDVFLDEEE